MNKWRISGPPARAPEPVAFLVSLNSAKKKVQRSGRNHYIAFCKGLGFTDLAPPLDVMRRRVRKRMADAPQTYNMLTIMLPSGKRKKALATGSTTTYLSHIDTWYATTSNQSLGSLSKNTEVSEMKNFTTASFRSRK